MSSNKENAIHYVCTYQQGKRLLAEQSEFYLRTCGCRARSEPPHHEDNNCCLWFTTTDLNAGETSRQISAADAAALLMRARDESYVIRPFRDFETKTRVIGICCCCTCCCHYFQHNQQEECDKGTLIEHTTPDSCNNCGRCVPACLFGVRTLQQRKLQLTRDRCFGCGVCRDVCPTKAVKMISR